MHCVSCRHSAPWKTQTYDARSPTLSKTSLRREPPNHGAGNSAPAESAALPRQPRRMPRALIRIENVLRCRSMPICAKCDHTGEGHNWISSACSRCSNRGLHCPFCFERHTRRRKRGQCRYPGCTCAAYEPLTSRPAPVNKHLGRVFYQKRTRK